MLPIESIPTFWPRACSEPQAAFSVKLTHDRGACQGAFVLRRLGPRSPGRARCAGRRSPHPINVPERRYISIFEGTARSRGLSSARCLLWRTSNPVGEKRCPSESVPLYRAVRSRADARASAASAGVLDDLTPAERLLVDGGTPLVKSRDVSGSSWPSVFVYQIVNTTPEKAMAIFTDYGQQASYLKACCNVLVSRVLDPAVDGDLTTQRVLYEIAVPIVSNERYELREEMSRGEDGSYRVVWVKVSAGGHTRRYRGARRVRASRRADALLLLQLHQDDDGGRRALCRRVGEANAGDGHGDGAAHGAGERRWRGEARGERGAGARGPGQMRGEHRRAIAVAAVAQPPDIGRGRYYGADPRARARREHGRSAPWRTK